MVAWKSAAMATPSSSLVQTSVILSSSVGKLADSRRSHQIFDASSMRPVFTSSSTTRRYSAALPKVCGRPERGSSTDIAVR